MPRKESFHPIIDRANANQRVMRQIAEGHRRFFSSVNIGSQPASPHDIDKRFSDQFARAQLHLVRNELTIEEVRFMRKFTGSSVFTINDEQREEARYGVRRLREKTLVQVFNELNIGQSE